MTRKPAVAIRVNITLELTPQVAQRIDELVKTGLFGFNREDAAERLICRAIVDVLPLLATTRSYQSSRCLADARRRP